MRNLLTAVLVAMGGAMGASAQIAFEDSFASNSGWSFTSTSATVGWEIDSMPAAFPGGIDQDGTGGSLNFNDGFSFRDGTASVAGSATSPPIDVTGINFVPFLTFWCNADTENDNVHGDRRQLEVSNDGFATTLISGRLAEFGYDDIVGSCWGYRDWHYHRIPMDTSWGVVQVRFSFDSVDGLLNDGGGWAIDHVKVEGEKGPTDIGTPDMVPTDSDLNDTSVYTTGGKKRIKFSFGNANYGTFMFALGDHDNAQIQPENVNKVGNEYRWPEYAFWAVWSDTPDGFRRMTTDWKTSWCLMDVTKVWSGTWPSSWWTCWGTKQGISVGWKDVYGKWLANQNVSVDPLPVGDYTLVCIADSMDRLPELDDHNQVSFLNFHYDGTNGNVPKLGGDLPLESASGPVVIDLAVASTLGGQPALRLTGAGYDVSVVVTLDGTRIDNIALVSENEMLVGLGHGTGAAPARVTVGRSDGSVDSFRLPPSGQPTLAGMVTGSAAAGGTLDLALTLADPTDWGMVMAGFAIDPGLELSGILGSLLLGPAELFPLFYGAPGAGNNLTPGAVPYSPLPGMSGATFSFQGLMVDLAALEAGLSRRLDLVLP